MTDDTYTPQPTTEFATSAPPPDERMSGPIKISNDEVGDKAFALIPPGTEFIHPDGTKRRKPYRVTDDASFAAVPEGEVFIHPDGTKRRKPKYEGLGVTAETLYQMARTPEEKKKALGVVYGDENIKDDPSGDFYVQDGDKRRKAGRGSILPQVGAHVLADVAPVTGAVAGGVLGGMSGSLVPGAGTAVGGVAGAGLGAATGQAVNDAILALAGVYGRTPGQEMKELGMAGAAGAAGEGAGRVIAGVAPTVKNAVNAVKGRAGNIAGKWLGADADPEATQTAARIATEGAAMGAHELVPPSAWAKESPYLKKIVETFDPEFRQQDVLSQAAEKYYNTKATKVLGDLGVDAKGPLTQATQAVSSEQAGTLAITRARTDLAAKDKELQEAMRASKMQAIVAGKPQIEAHQAEITRLTQLADSSRQSAQTLLDESFKTLQTDIDTVLKQADVTNPGDLWRNFSGKIQGFNSAVKARANINYQAADAAAGDAKPAIGGLGEEARDLLSSLPEDFQSKYPDIAKRLVGMGTEGNVTFGQLHQLRSWLRHDIDFSDLTPGVKAGIYKKFAKSIDDVLHQAVPKPQGPTRLRDPNETLPRYGQEKLPPGPAVEPTKLQPGLEKAARLLDAADAFYSKNMQKLEHETLRGVVKGIKAGLPADPEELAKYVLKPGHSEAVRELRKMVGPNLWSGVQAADTQMMLNNSKTLVPGEINGARFADQVLERVRNGLLSDVYGPNFASKVMTTAQRVAMIEGKLPITARPGDTVPALLQRAEQAAKQAELMAKTDPMGALTKELKTIDEQFKAARRDMVKEARKDPLYFLNHASATAMQSADYIISKPDLIIAMGTKFGEASPEFTALRQVYAQRMLQRPIGATAKLSKEFATDLTEKTQAMLFPGVTLENAKQIAKDMEFLLGGRGANMDAGGSMAAASRVLHPEGSIPVIGGVMRRVPIPGVAAGGRFMLSKFYSVMTKGVTNPTFINWIADSLRGSPAQRVQASNAVKQLFGALGAGTAETAEQESR